MTRQLPVQVPAGATNIQAAGPGTFVTRLHYELPDGRVVHWSSRASRKRRSNVSGHGLNWWIGLLFAIGSTCFMIGPLPRYVTAVGASADAMTFFIGSLFFTTAAYLSYMEVARDTGHRWFAWAPRHLGFWATLIQLVGTVFFNVTTYAATLSLPAAGQARLVWRPDAYGSICFLVASGLAFAEAGHRWWSWRPGHRDWHVTALNWWGSVFFGLSAIGAYTFPDGQWLSIPLANWGTFLGAACFLIAAVIMMPEGRDPGTAAPGEAAQLPGGSSAGLPRPD